MSCSSLVQHSALAVGIASFVSLSSLCRSANTASVVNGGFNNDLTGWTATNQSGSLGNGFHTKGSMASLGCQTLIASNEGARYAHKKPVLTITQ